MENKVIRKISIGSDVNNQLHISVGSIMGGNRIAYILMPHPNTYEIWIFGEKDSVSHWKSFENMPIAAEYDTRLN